MTDSSDNDSIINDSIGEKRKKKDNFTKRSHLTKASSIHHSKPHKKTAMEQVLQFNYVNYWRNISSNCKFMKETVAQEKLHNLSLNVKIFL